MSTPLPFVREAGRGPGVICLHANASTSSQWRELLERLAPRFRVFAPDAYGAGKSPDWPSDRVIRLRDEVDLIAPVFAAAGHGTALIGHSYGAAVALVGALTHPGAVRALALYEPTLFAVVDAASPPPNDAEGIREVVARAGTALDAGDRATAAELFIDYWMGPGSFRRMPPQRQVQVADSTANIRRWSHALFTEPTPIAALRALDIPVLCMVGRRSPRSAHAVAHILVDALPRARFVEFPDLGHMGPITHPGVVNEAIARFLEDL